MLEDHGGAEVQLHSQIFVTWSATAEPCQNGCSQCFLQYYCISLRSNRSNFSLCPKTHSVIPTLVKFQLN